MMITNGSQDAFIRMKEEKKWRNCQYLLQKTLSAIHSEAFFQWTSLGCLYFLHSSFREKFLRRTLKINSSCSCFHLGADGWIPERLNSKAARCIIWKYLNRKPQSRHYILVNLVQTGRSSAFRSLSISLAMFINTSKSKQKSCNQIWLDTYLWGSSTFCKKLPQWTDLAIKKPKMNCLGLVTVAQW